MDDGVRISELPKATQLEADAVIAGVNVAQLNAAVKALQDQIDELKAA